MIFLLLNLYIQSLWHLLVKVSHGSFSIQGLNPGPKNKVPVIGTASLNLADFASSAAEEKDLELTIPLTIACGATEPRPSLHVHVVFVLAFVYC